MTKKKLSELLDAMSEARDELDRAEDNYLRATGWTYSSTHPDFCWRWSKTIDGRNYSFCKRDAVSLQRVIDND
jgi:hypothetical protein